MDNINLMLKKMHGVTEDDTKLLSGNYSYICRFPESPLYQYIDCHIDDYMGIRLSTYPGVIEDQELDAIKLLNHEHVSERFKEDYIAQLGTIISNLHTIQNMELWGVLLEKKRVLHTEENVVAYWTSQNKLDTVLIDFINEFDDTIDFTVCKRDSDADLEKLFVSLVKCNSIQNRQYKDCAISLGFTWGSEFNISGLSIDKVKILAKNHIIQMAPATLRYLRNNYANAVRMYIESNFDDYVSLMTPQLMDQQELLMILKWDVADESKKKLIDIAPSSISVIGNDYSPELSVYILQKKPHSSDIPLLYETYDRQPDLIKDHMYTLAIKNIDSVIRGTIKTTTEIKCRFLNDDQTTDSAKQKLLLSAIKSLPQAEVMLCLDAAQKHEFSKIFNPRTKPRIDNNMQNKEILDVFKSRGWIANYLLNADSNEYEIQRPVLSKKRPLTPV